MASSAECWTALVGDVPVAMWGAVYGTLETEAAVWAAISEPVRSLPLSIGREARAFIANLLERMHSATMEVPIDDDRAQRFARFMGFSVVGRDMKDGREVYRMATGDVPGRPFMILGLPRSRTFWLSKLLSYGDYDCAHEQFRHIRGVADLKSWLAQDYTGCAETSAAPAWRAITHIRPDIRLVVVRRSVAEVVDSLLRLDLRGVCVFKREDLEHQMTVLDGVLDEIERHAPNVLSVRFDDLDSAATCRKVWEHCLPYRFDAGRWAALSGQNLQANMRALMRHDAAFGQQTMKAGAEISRYMQAIAQRPDRGGACLSEVTIQPEVFETFWRDGQALFAEHATEVGDRPGADMDVNVDQIRLLDEAGRLLILTARHRGRMVGYLVAVLGAGTDDRKLLQVEQKTLFVSQDYRGVGWRLQKTAVERLRAMGGCDLFFRAGIRGSGPRLSAFFERLGAEEYGRLYRLDLRAA